MVRSLTQCASVQHCSNPTDCESRGTLDHHIKKYSFITYFLISKFSWHQIKNPRWSRAASDRASPCNAIMFKHWSMWYKMSGFSIFVISTSSWWMYCSDCGRESKVNLNFPTEVCQKSSSFSMLSTGVSSSPSGLLSVMVLEPFNCGLATCTMAEAAKENIMTDMTNRCIIWWCTYQRLCRIGWPTVQQPWPLSPPALLPPNPTVLQQFQQ